MKKEKMVTRTMYQTGVKYTTVNISEGIVSPAETTIGGSYTDKELLEKMRELFDNDNVKVFQAIKTSEKEVLVGMPESMFYKYGKILPDRKDYSKKNEEEVSEN